MLSGPISFVSFPPGANSLKILQEDVFWLLCRVARRVAYDSGLVPGIILIVLAGRMYFLSISIGIVLLVAT